MTGLVSTISERRADTIFACAVGGFPKAHAVVSLSVQTTLVLASGWLLAGVTGAPILALVWVSFSGFTILRVRRIRRERLAG